jgi:hypothetical protein
MIGLSMNLKSHINLRFALSSSKELFYPSRVRSHLYKKVSFYSLDDYPAIAFAFGRSINRKWYILIMQSDLVSYSPSFIRDHFRGWRKILLYQIIKLAFKKNIQEIYLTTPTNINMYYQNSIKENEGLFKVLKTVYERTAKEFNMKSVYLRCPINIQLYPYETDLKSNHFFKLKKKEGIFFNGVEI